MQSRARGTRPTSQVHGTGLDVFWLSTPADEGVVSETPRIDTPNILRRRLKVKFLCFFLSLPSLWQSMKTDVCALQISASSDVTWGRTRVRFRLIWRVRFTHQNQN